MRVRVSMLAVFLLLLSCEEYKPAVGKPPRAQAPMPADAAPPAQTPEALAAAAKRREFVASMNKLAPKTPAMLIPTKDVPDSTIVFRVGRCEKGTPLELLRVVGKARLQELGFRRIGCVDGADVTQFFWLE